MKKQRGFIQIPILIAIIAGVLVLGGISYGVRQSQNHKEEGQKAAENIPMETFPKVTKDIDVSSKKSDKTTHPTSPTVILDKTDKSVYSTNKNSGTSESGTTNGTVSIDSNKIIHKTFVIHAVQPYQATYELKIDIPESTYNYYRQDSKLGRRFDATKNVASWATINEPILKHISDELRNLEKRDPRFPFLNSVFEVTKTIKYVSDYSKNDSGEYWNYPIETLVEGKGDCEDMAFLTAGILGSIGWDVLLAGLPGHMAMALEMPDVVIKLWGQTNYIPYEYY